MAEDKRRISERSLGNEDGQMAIFVALIFQVLFVFFAMVVNVGLVVHDKINLQNSVDLAAYYGAQRQAELLNEIAHINYQMRQDYKLMAWRMRVLGEFGRSNHPASAAAMGGSDVPNDAQEYIYSNSTSVCVAHPAWEEGRLSPGQSLCKDSTIFIPEIPPIPVIAPMNAFNFGFAAAVENLRNLFRAGCNDQGQLNWYFAAVLFSGYKYGMSTRKRMIQQIAQNLSSDLKDFKDQKLKSVRAGVLATLKNNLTASNLRGLREEDVETLNSMAIGPCADPNYWLPDIPIRPYLMYTDNQYSSGVGCEASAKPIFFAPTNSNLMPTLDPDSQLRNLTQYSDAVPVSNPMHSSLGFEKNPWCLVYYGVKAKTRPRKPFMPFGQAVELVARSFAEPFGGRIGPWYGSVWAKGEQKSGGPRSDPLAPPRLPLASPLPPDVLTRDSMPNYSRFPGDPLGLKSRAGIGAMRTALWQFHNPSQPGVALRSYEHLKNVPTIGDVLPWDTDNNRSVPIRRLELAAIAPDIFDVTYYSVDPNYSQVYFPSSLGTARFSGFRPISDLGTRFQPDAAMANNVRMQIETANDSSQPPVDRSIAYWVVRSPAHVLTGWTQKGSLDYGFPESRFGQCNSPQTPSPDAPAVGGCVVGGRVGYSIRHVSRDYLAFQQHRVGGPDSSGPIDNPPADAGW